RMIIDCMHLMQILVRNGGAIPQEGLSTPRQRWWTEWYMLAHKITHYTLLTHRQARSFGAIQLGAALFPHPLWQMGSSTLVRMITIYMHSTRRLSKRIDV